MPPYLQPEGVTSWPADYPQAFRDNTPALAGYTFADGSDHRARGYFAQASRVAFDFHTQGLGLPHRGLPVTMRDPLGHDTTTTYDRPFHLLPVRVTDAVGLTTIARNNYRVLQPRQITDANGNRCAVTFSPLGLVTTTWVVGKAGEPAGDTFEAPGVRLEYDFFAFINRQQPVFVRSIVRQHHVRDTDVPLPERDATIESVEYSDGFGRLLQTRTQAEDVFFGDGTFANHANLPPDQAEPGGPAVGQLADPNHPRVVVSGWQMYDNKGRVVEKYEPFFAEGWEFNPPTDDQLGQSVSMFYDPRGQVIRTVNPDGSEQRVIYRDPGGSHQPGAVHTHALGSLHLRCERSRAVSIHRRLPTAPNPDRVPGDPSFHPVEHPDRRPRAHCTRLSRATATHRKTRVTHGHQSRSFVRNPPTTFAAMCSR